MENVNIGIIGGSGLYQMPELESVREIEVDTPFGNPSCWVFPFIFIGDYFFSGAPLPGEGNVKDITAASIGK